MCLLFQGSCSKSQQDGADYKLRPISKVSYSTNSITDAALHWDKGSAGFKSLKVSGGGGVQDAHTISKLWWAEDKYTDRNFQ
jgi:hypothetical protein